MAMTWKELKTACLQKMFAIEDGVYVEDSSTLPYIKGMSQAANEALSLMSTAGRYVRKYLIIAQQADTSQSVTDENAEEIETRAVSAGTARYDLEDILDDFYSLDPLEIYLEDRRGYRRTQGFEVEAERMLLLNGAQEGIWRVWYNAYPKRLTGTTDDDYKLDVAQEVADILPLYMCSQLYKDDDISTSTIWRNEFETAREAIVAESGKRRSRAGRLTSSRGWW